MVSVLPNPYSAHKWIYSSMTYRASPCYKEGCTCQRSIASLTCATVRPSTAGSGNNFRIMTRNTACKGFRVAWRGKYALAASPGDVQRARPLLSSRWRNKIHGLRRNHEVRGSTIHPSKPPKVSNGGWWKRRVMTMHLDAAPSKP